MVEPLDQSHRLQHMNKNKLNQLFQKTSHIESDATKNLLMKEEYLKK